VSVHKGAKAVIDLKIPPAPPLLRGIKKDSGPVCHATGTGRLAGMHNLFHMTKKLEFINRH